MQSWLGLGSNLEQPVLQLEDALARLKKTDGIKILSRSSFYLTPPWGDENQDSFINAVVHIETCLEPVSLLRALQSIEDAMGRRRSTRRWGPRLIDIDLLLYENQSLKLPELELPHPCLHERAFVLLPLSELDDSLEIPGHGTVGNLLDQLEPGGICRLDRGDGIICRDVGGGDVEKAGSGRI